MNDEINERLDSAFCRKAVKRMATLRKSIGQAGLDLTPEQFIVLSIFNRQSPGMTVGAIAGQTETPFANVTRTIEGLEKKGHVSRIRSKLDRRKVMVRLTLEGKKIVPRINQVKADWLNSLWDVYSQREKTILLDLLSRIE